MPYSLPRPISSSHTLLLLPHLPLSRTLFSATAVLTHLVALKGTPPGAGPGRRVFRSPGVGAVMFALLPTLWVFTPTIDRRYFCLGLLDD